MSSYTWPSSGGLITEYATFASFPATENNGAIAVALDTDVFYIYNTGLVAWVVIASPSSANSIGAFGSTPNAFGASLTAGSLSLQPADGTHPGSISILAQTMGAGLKTFANAAATTSTLAVTSTFATQNKNAEVITASAAGFSNNTGLQVNFNGGSLAANGAGSGIKLELSALTANVDAKMTGLFVNADPNNPNICFGYASGPLIYPVYSQGNTRITLAAAWAYNGAVYTDISTGSNTIFAANADIVYVGATAVYGTINIALDTPASVSVSPTFFYWSGAAWTQIYPDDGTAGFTQSGQVMIIGQTGNNWASSTINAVPAYYVKIVRNAATVVTVPVEGGISGYSNLGASYWGPAGDLHVATVAASTSVTSAQLISTVSTGTPPLVVASTDLVSNLYVDRAALADVATSATSAVSVSGKFQSAVTVATGSSQNVAHGLGVTPSLVLISVYDDTNVGVLATGFVITEGTHTSTNIVVTCTANTKFKAIAFA